MRESPGAQRAQQQEHPCRASPPRRAAPRAHHPCESTWPKGVLLIGSRAIALDSECEIADVTSHMVAVVASPGTGKRSGPRWLAAVLSRCSRVRSSVAVFVASFA
jgi:hypothetical protein